MLGNGVSDSATFSSYRLRSKRLTEACAAELRENAEASSSDAGKGDKERRASDGRRASEGGMEEIKRLELVIIITK